MIKYIQNIISKIKIRNKINKLKKHSLKTEKLYRIAPFKISNLRECCNLDYTKLDFNEEKFEIKHHTNLERAMSILETQLIYGGDGNKGAHFMHIKGYPVGAERNGVILYFRWQGKQINTKAGEIITEPNLLHHVCSQWDSPIRESGEGYWEGRLYPGTNRGLTLIAMATSDDSSSIIHFIKPINISVVSKKNLPITTFFLRIVLI